MNKLKKVAATLLAVVLVCGCVSVPVLAAPVDQVEFTEVDEIVYADGNVNVRTGPGTEHTVIGSLNADQPIRRTGVGSNGWSRVVYNGETAYMYTGLLTTSAGSDRLARQLAAAAGLKEWEYTGESWKSLSDALDAAGRLKKNEKQEKRDAAADALEKAIAGLVRMDCTGLEAAIEQAKAQISGNAVYDLVDQLRDAITQAEQIRYSGDQAQVDACAAEITALLEQLNGMQGQPGSPEVIIQEVEVEVPPTGDYCNISGHRTLLVVCTVSIVLNVILAAVLIFVSRRHKYRADDVPLVDYNIDDDI